MDEGEEAEEGEKMPLEIIPSQYGDLLYKEQADKCIEAMKEKVERENQKPCETCLILERKREPIEGSIGQYAIHHKVELPFISINLVESGIKISGQTAEYCFKCGRKLSERG